MMTNFSFGALCVICSIVISTNAETPNISQVGEEDDYTPLKDSSWSDPFDWKLLKAFASKDYKNVLISPLSLKLVLALLYEGASGETALQFQRTLGFPEDRKALREKYAAIIDVLQGEREEYIFNLGTRIFLDSSIQPLQQYASKAKQFYKTDIAATNFTDTKDASNIINTWIDTSTNGRIKKIVTPDDIENAILVISNAIFFKGLWRLQFPKNQTHRGGFYVTPTDILRDVSYMSNTDKYFYCESESLDAKIVRIPYRGKKFALFIVLPNGKKGLPALLDNLSLNTLKNVISLMDEITVELVIPKFRFDFQARFGEFLQEIGLQDMFQNTGSFPGIARGMNNNPRVRSLYVSDILQKAGIEITEEGSVVYAATEVTLGNKFGESQSTFNATRPFLFFIEEQTTKTILFIGKVENPLQAEPIPLPSRFSENVDTQKVTKPERENTTKTDD